MSEAWQTYHDRARAYLADLEPKVDGAKVSGPILSTETTAQVATAWALLALVEVLKPRAEEVLEVTSTLAPSPFPAAFCGDTTEHSRHIWTVEDASPFSPSTSLRECRGWEHGGDHTP